MNRLKYHTAAGAVLLVFIFMFTAPAIYGSDWKYLHEKAESLSLFEAMQMLKNHAPTAETLYMAGIVFLINHMEEKAEHIFRRIYRGRPFPSRHIVGFYHID